MAHLGAYSSKMDGKKKSRKAKVKKTTAHLKKKVKKAVPHRGGSVPAKGTVVTTRTMKRAPAGGSVTYKRKKT